MSSLLSALFAILVVAGVGILGFRIGVARHRANTDARVEASQREAEQAADRAARAEAVANWLRTALDESSDGIVIVDRIGREVLRNAVARRFLDARDAELLAEDALMQLLLDAREGLSAEREVQLYGPPRQVLHLRAYVLRRDGEVVGAVAFARDITETRRADQVRRDFVANVSHELKTPIGALALLAETMAASDDPAVVRPLGERIVREADRLAQIVDKLLDLSTIEAQETPNREAVPLATLVADGVEIMQASADAAGVELNISPEPPAHRIVCDQRQLTSALVNLIDNAIKYSDRGSIVEVGATSEGDRAILTVRDYGIGIPTRDLERVFERFYRVDRARNRATGGTGLGLSIVRHIAQAHGGEVTVDSHEGEGSLFSLYVPLEVRACAPPEAEDV